MKGLLIKDFINIKRQLITFSAFIVLYIVLSLSSGDATVFQGVIVILFAMLPVTALAYDERTKWDKYMIALPVSRRQIVGEKYLFGAIMSIAAAVIGFLFDMIVTFATGEAFNVEALIILGVFAVVALLFLSLNLPLMFKFGTEKGRFFIIAVSVVIILVPGLFMNVSVTPPDDNTVVAGIAVGTVISIILFFVSMFISMRVYEKKDF